MKKRKTIILLITTLLMIMLLSSFNMVNAKIDGKSNTTIDNPDSMIRAADDWTDQNAEITIDQQQMDTTVNSVYRILLTIGIIVSVVWGGILGVKFMFGSMEDRVDIKKHLLPYVIWVCVIFGSFIIWSVVVAIMHSNFN